jgi:hypothetical protein
VWRVARMEDMRSIHKISVGELNGREFGRPRRGRKYSYQNFFFFGSRVGRCGLDAAGLG